MFLKDPAMQPEVTASSSARDVPKRGELRVGASVGVRILGIDANGKPFYCWATTQDISLSGARITGLAAKLCAGEVVGVQCSGIKTRFKVAWVQQNANGTCEAGLQCMQRGAAPWREDADQADRLSREVYSCHGRASLEPSGANAISGTVRELSLTGCFVEAEHVVAEGEILRGKFFFSGMQFDAVAMVRSSVPGSGMGLQWTDLGTKGHTILSHLFSTVAALRSEDELCAEQVMSRIDKLREALTMMCERLESGTLPVNADVVRELDNAHARVTAALNFMQP